MSYGDRKAGPSFDLLVDLRPLKRLVAEKLMPESPLRRVLLGEKDRLSAVEFATKIPIWLTLLECEEEDG